jgi:hypothetical protein
MTENLKIRGNNPGFAFGLFAEEAHALNPLLGNYFTGASDSERDRNRASRLYSLGCVLEERLLLSQGAALGVFPIEPAVAWLKRDETILREFDFDSLGEEDAARLPRFIDSRELVEWPIDPSTHAKFEAALWFRQYEGKRHRDLPGYRYFQRTLLFGSDEEWEKTFGDVARSVADLGLLADGRTSPSLEAVHETVVLCSDLLGIRTKNAIEGGDPWGVSPRGTRFAIPDVELSALSKADSHVVAEVKSAAESLASGVDSYLVDVFEDLFSLQLIHVARLPLEVLDRSPNFDMRLDIIQAVPTSVSFQAIFTIGPRLSWAACLWRLAPCDTRSQERLTNVATVLSEALQVAIRNNDPGIY